MNKYFKSQSFYTLVYNKKYSDILEYLGMDSAWINNFCCSVVDECDFKSRGISDEFLDSCFKNNCEN